MEFNFLRPGHEDRFPGFSFQQGQLDPGSGDFLAVGEVVSLAAGAGNRQLLSQDGGRIGIVDGQVELVVVLAFFRFFILYDLELKLEIGRISALSSRNSIRPVLRKIRFPDLFLNTAIPL